MQQFLFFPKLFHFGKFWTGINGGKKSIIKCVPINPSPGFSNYQHAAILAPAVSRCCCCWCRLFWNKFQTSYLFCSYVPKYGFLQDMDILIYSIIPLPQLTQLLILSWYHLKRRPYSNFLILFQSVMWERKERVLLLSQHKTLLCISVICSWYFVFIICHFGELDTCEIRYGI